MWRSTEAPYAHGLHRSDARILAHGETSVAKSCHMHLKNLVMSCNHANMLMSQSGFSQILLNTSSRFTFALHALYIYFALLVASTSLLSLKLQPLQRGTLGLCQSEQFFVMEPFIWCIRLLIKKGFHYARLRKPVVEDECCLKCSRATIVFPFDTSKTAHMPTTR